MSERPPQVRSRSYRVVFVLVFIGAILTGLFFLAGQVATSENAYRRSLCNNNLRAIYPFFLEYVNAHDRLPVDEQGRFSLKELAKDQNTDVLLGLDLHPCAGDDVESCYLLGVDVLPEDIGKSEAPFPRVLLYDRPGNHIQVLGNGLRERRDGIIQEEASLLLCDGSIVVWRGDSLKYAEWAKLHATGAGEQYPPGIADRF